MLAMSSADRGDFADVLAFWMESTTVASSTDDLAGLEQLVAVSPDSLLVARDGGTLVGTLIAAWDGWRASMYRLAVAPSHRRQGIGRALVTEGERRLRAKGARRFHLIVEADEPPAHAFWSAAGYERTNQLRFVKTVTTSETL